MVQIFIVYGGPEGEKIGRKVQVYFKANNIGAFLASPKSSDLKPSEDFQIRINKELKTANLAVIVVTNGIKSSKPALAEIDRIINDLKYPWIPFVRRHVTPPKQLKRKWNVHFKSDSPSKSELIQLELEMWRYYDQWRIRQMEQVGEGEEVAPKTASGLKVE